jgi:hypothetical protein
MIPLWTRRTLLTAMVGMLAALPWATTSTRAESRPPPNGPVILTVAGDIAQTNRGPSDPKLDGFLKYHEIEFKKAFVFDLAMLEEFPLTEIHCQPPQYSSSVTFQGPRLREVLKALEAEGASIKTRALDGFAVDLTAAQIAAKDWILATRADRRPFGIGDKGPIWLMHPPSAEKVREDEEQGWPWAVFYIEGYEIRALKRLPVGE